MESTYLLWSQSGFYQESVGSPSGCVGEYNLQQSMVVGNFEWRCVKMGSGSEKWEVAVKVGVESEVAMCENGKWWSKVVRNGK
jgi:hypothetical protein